MNKEFPRRGGVWIANFNPGRGSEQKGIRPALIIQNDIGNQYASTTIVAAITSKIKPYPVTVIIEKGEAGLHEKSMVNLAQILTIDKGRLIRRLKILPDTRMEEVDRALKVSLRLEKI